MRRLVRARPPCFSTFSGVVPPPLPLPPAAGAAAPPTFVPAPGVPPAAARRLSSMFYDPSVRLSRRQQHVFTRPADMPALRHPEDHGFLYGFTAADLSGASASVKRALSTRTGDAAMLRRHSTAQLVTRYGKGGWDTGNHRVQSACLGGGRGEGRVCVEGGARRPARHAAHAVRHTARSAARIFTHPRPPPNTQLRLSRSASTA
jgi:hypothetical protein